MRSRVASSVDLGRASSAAKSMNHDVVAIGGSAGSIEVLLRLVAKLPRDLPAAVLIAVHTSADSPGLLPELLSHRGSLPASFPLDGERILNGHVYVAPDTNLLVREGTLGVVRGPLENGHRPSIDALFRTASAVYGARVVGVVLSGFQDSGATGLLSIRAGGGIAVAQDPKSAVAAPMPTNAIARGAVDLVAPAEELADVLLRLVSSPVDPARAPEIFASELPFPCRACLERARGAVVQRALWGAIRALEREADLSRCLHSKEKGHAARHFAEEAERQEADAEVLRRLLLGSDRPRRHRRSKARSATTAASRPVARGASASTRSI
jgi:hypothetical protein